jgi:hypothetical protein
MLTRNVRTDGFVDPCAPIRAAKPPSGPGWVHEIKHDISRCAGAGGRRPGTALKLPLLWAPLGHGRTKRSRGELSIVPSSVAQLTAFDSG